MSEENEATRKPTLGEERCHLTFNPSDDSDIYRIKKRCADLIDDCAELSTKSSDPEAKRCFSIAMTEIETAQMYAVKGVAKSF